MAKNKTTYTLQIDAELGNLESKLSSVKGLLAGVLGSANAPKGLEKTIEKIEGLIDRVRAKASQPINSKAGFTSISKDVDGAQVALSGLLKIVQSINSLPEADRLSFLPPDAQAQIQKVIDGLSAYAAAIDTAVTESQELATARIELAKAEEKVAKAQENLDKKTSYLEEANAEKQAAADAIKAIEDRKKKLAELRAEQEKIEKFYDTPDENGQKRNKSKKYSEVSMRPQDIKRKVADMEKSVAGDDAAIEGLQKRLKSATNDIKSYEVQVDTASRVLRESNQIHDALAQKVQDLNDQFEASKPQNQQAAFDALRKEAQDLGVSLDGIGTAFSDADASELIKRLVEIKTKGLDKVGKAADKATTEVVEFGTGLKNIKDDVEEGTEALENMTEAAAQKEAFENKIKQFLGLQGAAQLMRAALRDAIATVKELDATMTEMAVVTDLTVGDYWDQLPEYSKRASDLGVSINSAYKAATLYYQQGLKTNEVVALSNETLKMAKIAGIDAAEATDKMTAALRGFNMELNEASAQKIADVYSELAAITAADVDEISTAMTKTASIASSAGMEFETTAAFLSQIIETTRESAETAGTAMKTVIARFQELKKSPNEIGEVDGEIVDANAIETALRSVGVSLRDTSGQFRELDDVFLELSSKWSSLDKNTQRYIATIAAGSRQQSRFIAMMQDYGRTQELVTAANTSAGASQKQFEKTMESLEAKVEKLKNAWHEFTMGIMNSDLVKFGVDVLTKFLEIVNKATKGLDGIGGSITKIMGIMVAFNLGKKIFEKLKQPLVSFFAEIVSQAMETGEKAGDAATEGLNKSQQKSTKEVSSKPYARKGYKIASDGSVRKENGQFISKEEAELATTPTMGHKVAKKTGVIDISEGFSKRRDTFDEIMKNRKQSNDKDVRSSANKYAQLQKNVKNAPDKEAKQQATKELEKYRKELKLTDEEQKKMTEAGIEGFQQVGKGLGAMGQAAVAAGTGISMLGGLFQTLGMEEFGEALSKAGQYVTIFGSILMTLPTIFSTISAIATATGITISAALWMVTLIVAAIAIVAGTIAAIAASIKKASPEEKLKRAQEAADGAAEAADRAAESYNNLKDSLNDLDAGYDALENMRRGTDEWNEAVQKLNNSVLDLINQYPELAGLVENEGGVLTLDIDSQAVQDVLQGYKDKVATTKGAELGMKAQVVEAQQQVDFANLDAVKKVGKQRGWQAAAGATSAGVAIGAGAGAGSSLLTGPFAPILAGPLAAIGAVVGGIGGAITGAIAGPIKAAGTKTDEELQAAVEEMALSVQEGATNTDYESIYDYLIGEGVAADEARVLAESFAEDTDALLEYGATLSATNAAQKAYYQAMATNAQSMIDLGKYSEEAIDQMSSVVDADKIKQYEEELKETYADDDSKATEAELEKYMEGLEGVKEVKKIKDNKVVYIDEEGKTQKVDKEIYMQQMIAAKATEKAASAMEKVPEALSNAASAFGDNLAGLDTFKKAFSADEGMALNASELTALSEAELKTVYDQMGSQAEEIWGSQDKFIADYQDRVKKANKAFENAGESMKKLGFETDKASELFGKMSAESAKAWANTLETINMGGGDTQALHGELTNMLAGLTEEQVNAVMGQINAMDMADIGAWKELKYIFDDLNIPIATDALQAFIDKGIEVSNAIEKIDFDGLNESLNNTYELIKKIKEDSTRSFGEEEYKKFVANNKGLEKQFMQIGDEFVYMGGAIQDLVAALEENTIANIEEANRQLDSKITFSEIAEGIEKKNVGDMNEAQLRAYLNEAISKSAEQGKDVADLGVAGFSNTSDLYAEGVDKETLLKWAQAFAATGGQKIVYEEQKKEGMHQANVLEYAYRNTATENAAGRGSAYAEALQYQAIQSGGVSEAQLATLDQAIEALKAAEEDGDEEAIQQAQENVDAISGNIANATEKIVESNKGRDAMQDLIDRVTDALYDQTQKEIDKLQEIKDATEEANTALITKLQEQIDTSRQQREQEKERQNIADMQSQMAYLGMDTSGANSLEMVGLDQQIAEAEQAYQDSLIDQAIQQLQDANDHAAEQRERQITLAQEQLDYQRDSGQLTKQAQEVVEDSLSSIKNGVDPLNTTLGQLLWGSEGENKGLGDLAKQDWVSDLQLTAIQAGNWLAQQGAERGEKASENETEEEKAARLAKEEADKKKAQNIADRNNILASVESAAISGNAKRDGLQGAGFSANIEGKRSAYAATFGSEGTEAYNTALADFDAKTKSLVEKNVVSGSVDKVSVSGLNTKGGYSGTYDEIDVTMNDHKYTMFVAHTKDGGSKGDTSIANDTTAQALNNIVGGSPKDGWIAMYNKIPYIYVAGNRNKWYTLTANPDGDSNVGAFTTDYLNQLRQYKTGGLADFTGPAWLDGTPSRPEYILNAAQTERFFSLIDVLEGYDAKEKSSKSAGDNYFDININVEKLEDDYDVEQIANKIRRMIYDDATYRNVNAINHIR